VKRIVLALVITGMFASSAFAACITNDGYLASPSKDVVKRSTEYAASRDFKAFESLLNTRQAFILKSGMRVNITDRAFGMVKVRPQGQTAEAWTTSEAVNCR
jgi:hypothetical protein